MAAEAHTRCLTLLTYLSLLTFLQAAFSEAPIDRDVPPVCNMASNQKVSLEYHIPKRFGQSHLRTLIYYKMKEDTVWKTGKRMGHAGALQLQEWIEAPFKPTSLYQIRVVTDDYSRNSSDIYDQQCEFCSQTDKLEPVYNLTALTVGRNWFGLAWKMPPRICPKEVNYQISYNITNARKVIEYYGHSDVLTLSTGEYYTIIGNVLPNNTYIVSIEVSVNELNETIYGPSVSTTLQTLPKPKPVVLQKPPYVINATNTTLKLSLHSESLCNNLCIATWQFKEVDESAWRFAGRRSIAEDLEITHLNASSMYQVRALIQNDYEWEAHESEDVPFVEATTLPVLDPITPENPPQVIKATNTSLTMTIDCQENCRKGYIAHWEYLTKNETWRYAGEELAIREMTIKDLEPDTDYEIRYSLHWPSSNNYSEFGPTEEVKTCPNHVPRILYVWAGKRDLKTLRVWWSVNATCRVQFLLRSKPYNTDDEVIGYLPDSYDANNCPYNATLLNCTNLNDCFDSTTVYSYTLKENITPATRYYVEVTSMDWKGRCAESKYLETASPFRYWGGISFGLWVLIIVGMLLLFAAVPACVIIKKRVAARMDAGRDVTFNASCNGPESNEGDIADADAIIFHEPTTRILDRRSEPPDT